jgi:hypothetical protein
VQAMMTDIIRVKQVRVRMYQRHQIQSPAQRNMRNASNVVQHATAGMHETGGRRLSFYMSSTARSANDQISP